MLSLNVKIIKLYFVYSNKMMEIELTSITDSDKCICEEWKEVTSMYLRTKVNLTNLDAVDEAREEVFEKINDLHRALQYFQKVIDAMSVEISQPAGETPAD